VPITVYSSWVDMFKGVLGLQGKEKLKFTVKGRMRIEGRLLTPSTIPFKAEQELSSEQPGRHS
jgi:hypothetical protein